MAAWVDRLLMQGAILGLVALVLVQALMTQPSLRRLLVLHHDGLEGVRWEELMPRPAGAPGPVAPPAQAGAAGSAAAPAVPTPRGPTAAGLPPAGQGGARPAAPAAGGPGPAAGVAVPGTAGARVPPAGGATAPSPGSAAFVASGPAVPATAAAGPGQVTVTLLGRPAAPGVRLLVGGQPAAEFTAGQVTVQVWPGQALAVDARAVADPLTFRVVAVRGLSAPALGSQVVTRGNVQVIGLARAAQQEFGGAGANR